MSKFLFRSRDVGSGWLVVCSLFTVSIAPSSLFAQATTKNPLGLLTIRPSQPIPGDHVSADYQAISGRYAEARKLCDELWQKYEDKKLVLADGKLVGALELLICKLTRDWEYLKLRAEPCGYDLQIKVGELSRRRSLIVNELIKTPGFNSAALMEQFKRAHDAGLKRLPPIQNLITRKQFVMAERELYEIVDEMRKYSVWFPDGDFRDYYSPFLVPVDAAVALRKQNAEAELVEILKGAPDFAKLQADLQQAASAIGSTGQATWNGQTVTGPQLIDAWRQQWPAVQGAAQRTAMTYWSLTHIRNANAGEHVALLTAQKAFVEQLPAAIAAIIAADAKRASAAEAATLYPAYVEATAALCATGPRRELMAACEPALKALAEKSGKSNDIAAYTAAVEPLLAWKRFMARSQLGAVAKDAPAMPDWCNKVCGPPHQPNTILPEEKARKVVDEAYIVNSVDLVLPNILPMGPAPTISASDVVPVGSRWVARYHHRVFAVVGAPPAGALQQVTNQLERQLLVTAAAKPLSLNAATVLATARLGVFETAGGPVDQVVIEPLTTRFVTLQNEAGAMLPLEPLRQMGNEGGVTTEQATYLSLRCDLTQPAWWQHECFVLKP